MKKIYVIDGSISNDTEGQINLSMPDFGDKKIKIGTLFDQELKQQKLRKYYKVEVVLVNHDIQSYIDQLVQKEDTKAIICYIDNNNTIGNIRKFRKDIFVVGFQNTTNKSPNEQYISGLELLKKNSINLVFSTDLTSSNNMIIAPEETRYSQSENFDDTLKFLTKMTISRMQNKFTKSTVVEGTAIDWNSEAIPENLREVVNHCIKQGAYKPFLGKTAGHFAVKVNEGEILTSIRKSNFNELDKVGLVKVESQNNNEVIAHGFRPSVGGQSQRIIFKEHPDLDCIVHFHCPVKEEYKQTLIPVKEQWPNECGSHQCGQNTSNGLKEIDLDGHKISVVYLDEHGPNVVFNKKVPSEKVIGFIDKHFDLSQKTGGLMEAV